MALNMQRQANWRSTGAAGSTQPRPATRVCVSGSRRSAASPAAAPQQRSRLSLLRCATGEASAVQTAPAASTVPTSDTWELDFCSRPLLDERGKKVWELLITDPERAFTYSQYFPNSKINSAEVGRALAAEWWMGMLHDDL